MVSATGAYLMLLQDSVLGQHRKKGVESYGLW